MNPADWLPGAVANGAEATVLALVVWAITRRMRNAAVAHTLWCAVLVDLVVPPLLTIPVASVRSRTLEAGHLEAAAESAPEFALADPELTFADPAPPEVASWTVSFPEESRDSGEATASPAGASWTAADLASRAWIGGSLAFLVFTLVRVVAFHRSLQSARPAPLALRAIVVDRARRAGLAHPPEVLLVDATLPPLVWALCGRARLIFPAGLLDRLTALQVEMLIAHEIAHLARRDHWLRWPETVVVSLYWWCPAAWWARARLRRAEEDCCDGHVREAFPRAPLEYAKALMETVDFLSASRPIPAMASGLGREGRLLKRRFDMILDHAPGHSLSRSLRAVLLVSLAAVLPWSPGIVAGQEDVDAGDVKLPEPVKTDRPEKQPSYPDKPDNSWNPKAPAGDVETRLASLEKQVAALLEEIKRSRAADTDSDYQKTPSYPVKGKLGWKKWEENPLISGGRDYRIEKDMLSAIDPKTKKTLWVTVLPFADPKIQVMDKLVHVTDGRNLLVIDATTGKVLKEALRVENVDTGDRLDPEKNRKLWKKNELPGLSDATSKHIEDLKAEKLKLLERLAEIEALEQKLEGANKPSKPVK